jgi:hypothetical protein
MACREMAWAWAWSPTITALASWLLALDYWLKDLGSLDSVFGKDDHDLAADDVLVPDAFIA